MATKIPGDIINVRIQCRSITDNSVQLPITNSISTWYRCREDWFLIASALSTTATAITGMYTFTYTLSSYSDPGDINQPAEQIRFRFNYTTTAGSFHKDIFFDYSTA